MLFISCDKEHFVFNKTEVLPVEGWKYNDRVGFNVPVVDTNYIYNLILEVENEADYPYQNAYLKIWTKFPEGDTLSQALSLELFDNEGQPNGECSDELCKSIINMQDSVYFNQLGHYYFGFEQYGRQEVMTGLKSLTLKLQKTDVSITAEDKK